MDPPPQLFAPGDLAGERYRIVRPIGRGGTGEVYEAEDLVSGERVALKTLLPELLGSTKAARRFERERDFSRRISHPNVLAIAEVLTVPLPPTHREPGAEAPLVPCMVMELLPGETLADRLARERPMPSEEALPIVCQVAAALAAAHRAGVVHRDLKPDNIFLVDEGTDALEGAARVVVTDFGVARPAIAQKADSLTASNVLLGTPAYMAPEQLELEEAMPASDVYTLGLVMFEMVTGRPAFEADSALQMVFKRVEEKAPSPRQLVPDLDPRWETVIGRCLERAPEDRFDDPLEIIRTLDGDSSPWLVAERRRHRRKAILVAAAVATAAILAAALFWLL